MFEIKDGRSEFYQWDIDRQLVVKDDSINQVHFCNHTDECSLVCEVYEKDGEYLVNVPNILLQESWIIKVYGYDKNYTRYCKNFKVVERTKPYDYVYTETEVLTYETLNNRIDELEAKGVSPEKLEQALDTYFESNPITHPVTSVNGKTGEVVLAASDVGAATSADIESAAQEVLDSVDTTLEGYAKVTDIPDVSGFATKEEIPEMPDLSGYALKSEIPTMPDLSGYALKTEIPDVSGFQTEEQVNALIEAKLPASGEEVSY